MAIHLRRRLNEAPPVVTYAAAAVLLVISAGLIYLQTRPPPQAPVAADPDIYLKCMNPACGNIVKGTLNDFLKKGYITTESMVGSGAGGTQCAQCRKAVLRFARKCTLCTGVFVPDNAKAGREIICPHCGKKPYAR